MTGPEHYGEAEKLLESAADAIDGERTVLTFGEAVAEAQVHATLALAAATGVNSADKDERHEWQRAAGVEL